MRSFRWFALLLVRRGAGTLIQPSRKLRGRLDLPPQGANYAAVKIFPFGLALALALTTAGCKKAEPPAPPPPPPPPAAAALPPGHPPIGDDMRSQTLPGAALTSAPNPHWSPPAHWQLQPPAPMRRATFQVPGTDGQTAEVVVSAFPGEVGGLLANLNRWRSQVGLEPIGEQDVGRLTGSLDFNGITGTVVDFAGPQQRMVVVILRTAAIRGSSSSPARGRSWRPRK